MAETSSNLLNEIPKLAKAQDAAALVALEDHSDKKVRKAARKAVHVLRSKGIEIPTVSGGWNPKAGLEKLRGDIESVGIVNVQNAGGTTEIIYIDVDSDTSSLVVAALLSPTDRVLNFRAIRQTDGKRNRMVKEWAQVYGERRVPAAWAKQRMLWAREETKRQGFPVPPDMEKFIGRLGDAPSDRPNQALSEELAGGTVPEESQAVQNLLLRANCHRWPLLFNAEALFSEITKEFEGAESGEAEGGKDEAKDVAKSSADSAAPEGADQAVLEMSEEEKTAGLARAAKGDDEFRTALSGTFANILDDSSVWHWLRGDDDSAKGLSATAKLFRAAAEPETNLAALTLLRFQIASFAMKANQPQGKIG